MRTSILFACAVLFVAPAALANGEAINGFPNWQERVMLEWTNRARCDPQVEMTACGGNCPEKACYTPIAPVGWSEKLNHAARFHSDNMKAIGFFNHPSACTLVNNIDALYPGTCQGAASCACVGGTATCTPTCTSIRGVPPNRTRQPGIGRADFRSATEAPPDMWSTCPMSTG